MTYPEYDMTAARNPRRWCRLLYLPVLPAGRMSSGGRYPPAAGLVPARWSSALYIPAS